MNAQERFLETLNFGKPDRLPLMEFMYYWPETLERWQQEGLPAGVDLVEYFGYDRFEFLPVDFNFLPPFEVEVFEEDEETRIVRDATGVIKREFKHGSAMPHYLEFPIKTRRDFLELKERLDPDDPARYPPDWEDRVRALKSRDYPVGLVCRGFLAFGRDFMEFTTLMMAFMDQPEWIEEMMEFHLDFMLRLWERALSEVEVDMVLLGEDMAYKTGPMISPALVKELMVPRYRKLCDFLAAHGVTVRFIDSDGDVRQLIPLFLEGGMTGTLPLEANAGCDPLELRRLYPRLQMIGGLNKQVVAQGGRVMEDYVRSRVAPLAKTKGYIPSFDHSVHPGTSFEVYQDYLKLLKHLVRQV